MGVAGPRGKVAGDVLRLERERRHAAQDLVGGNPDGHHVDASRERRARAGDEAALEPAEGQCQHRADGRTRCLAAVGGDTGRDVECDDGTAARVDALDQPRDTPSGRPVRARAEKRIHDQVRAPQPLGGHAVVLDELGAHAALLQLLELRGGVAADLVLGERQEDLDPRARLLQPPRHDEAVAAVAALAAHDDDTRAKTLNPPLVEKRPDPLRGPTPGVLHEGRARDAELGDRASIETPHLLRREDAVHGGYRPGS